MGEFFSIAVLIVYTFHYAYIPFSRNYLCVHFRVNFTKCDNNDILEQRHNFREIFVVCKETIVSFKNTHINILLYFYYSERIHYFYSLVFHE